MKPLYSYQHKSFIFETFDHLPKIEGIKQLDQVHGDNIVSIQSENQTTADGFIFMSDQLKNNTPAIRTADCLPIWIMNDDQHYFLHAGWRGLYQNILKTIPKIDFALIGPSIQSSSFEVQSDFKKYFSQDDFYQNISQKLTFDLQAYAKKLIRDISEDAVIIDSGLCTYQDQRFHSYRRDKTSDRNWSIIRSLG